MASTSSWTTLFGVTVALLTTASPALALPGPADDRLMQTPTDWDMKRNLSVSDVSAINDAGTWRITDLRVEGTSPLTFSVTLVKNTGAYSVANPFFFHGLTPEDAFATFHDNDKRPIVMQGYVADGVTKVAGITVPNTGADQRNWGHLRGSYDYVTSHLQAGFRPMTIGTYVNESGNRNYVLITVENTEGYGWAWSFGLTPSELDDAVGPYDSIIDASCNDNLAMECNVVLYDLPTTHGVVQGTAWYDTSYSDIKADAGAFQRALFVTHYTLHGSGSSDGDTEYFASLVDDY